MAGHVYDGYGKFFGLSASQVSTTTVTPHPEPVPRHRAFELVAQDDIPHLYNWQKNRILAHAHEIGVTSFPTADGLSLADNQLFSVTVCLMAWPCFLDFDQEEKQLAMRLVEHWLRVRAKEEVHGLVEYEDGELAFDEGIWPAPREEQAVTEEDRVDAELDDFTLETGRTTGSFQINGAPRHSTSLHSADYIRGSLPSAGRDTRSTAQSYPIASSSPAGAVHTTTSSLRHERFMPAPNTSQNKNPSSPLARPPLNSSSPNMPATTPTPASNRPTAASQASESQPPASQPPASQPSATQASSKSTRAPSSVSHDPSTRPSQLGAVWIMTKDFGKKLRAGDRCTKTPVTTTMTGTSLVKIINMSTGEEIYVPPQYLELEEAE